MSDIYHLWRLAVTRNLQVDELSAYLFRVSSYSRPGHWYSVEMVGQGWRCSCPAGDLNKPCSHAALVQVQEDLSLQSELTRRFFAEHRALVYRIATGTASAAEIRRARRDFRQHYPNGLTVETLAAF